MKSSIAITAGKLAGKASQFLGKGGSNIPGVVARKIDENLLEKLAEKVEKIVLVTGTNGKTTTSNLLAQIIREEEGKVITNAEGANLITGITACFVKHANPFGKLKYKYAIIEVDEASLPKTLAQIKKPNMIVVNNFFRDQLDRFGEIDILLKKVSDGIEPVKTKLVLNADDPFTVRLSLLGKENIFFGVHKDAHTFEKHEMSDSKFCPSCGEELSYAHVHYGQLGYFSCTCGFKRPMPRDEVGKIDLSTGVNFTVGRESYGLTISGIHNVYNALAAITAARELKISEKSIKKGLLSYTSSNGRMQSFHFNEHTYKLNLVKNPAGVNISLSDALVGENDKQMVLFLNDLDLDGTDISWIWDADYERLNRPDVKTIICSGLRAYDLAVRMKYAGVSVDKIKVIENKEEAIDEAVKNNMQTYMLPNYTTLEPVRKYLSKKEKSAD